MYEPIALVGIQRKPAHELPCDEAIHQIAAHFRCSSDRLDNFQKHVNIESQRENFQRPGLVQSAHHLRGGGGLNMRELMAKVEGSTTIAQKILRMAPNLQVYRAGGGL